MRLVGGTIWVLVALPVPFPLGMFQLLSLSPVLPLSLSYVKVRGQSSYTHTALCSPSGPPQLHLLVPELPKL